MATQQCNGLIGRKAICNYLQISKTTFYDLVECGLPVRKLGRLRDRWIGHCDELDRWFAEVSCVKKEEE